MDKTTKNKFKATSKLGYIILTVVTASMGVALLAFGAQSLDALAITIGAITALCGVVIGVFALADKARGFSFAMKVILAASMLISGVVTMITRENAINTIIGIFGLFMIIDGTLKLYTVALSIRYKAWGKYLLMSVATFVIAVGYITVRYFDISISATPYILGISFIIDSVANLFSILPAIQIDKSLTAEAEAALAPQEDTSETSNSTEKEG